VNALVKERVKKPKKSKTQEKSEKRAATFFRVVEERLRPLLDEYELSRTRVEDGGGYTYYSMVFQNEHAAVRVYFEWPEQYLSVQLCRLVNGKVQRNPESLDSEWTCFHIDDLLTVRVPEYDQSALLLPQEWKSEEATMDEVGQSLDKYADALRQHGGDVLRGDFSVFPQLEKIAKHRAIARGAL
jgi:hypothetical protein